jgi:phosphoribosylaminoimidazole-succinocarboxamide synthase
MSNDSLAGLTLFNRGKVRDIYDLGDKLLLVASDRISAFDVILPTLIPDKGKILTALSVYWFGVMHDIIPHHLITTNVDEFRGLSAAQADWESRTMLVKSRRRRGVHRSRMPRRSGWKDCQQTGPYAASRQGFGEASASTSRSSRRPPRLRWGIMTSTSRSTR